MFLGGSGIRGLIVTQHSPPSWLVPDTSGTTFCIQTYAYFSVYMSHCSKNKGLKQLTKYTQLNVIKMHES